MAISSHLLERRRLDGHDLSYLVGGSGEAERPPLLLVHGLAGASSNWLDLARRLGSRYRLLVPDLPGHGGSGPGSWPPTVAGLGAAVRACADMELDDRPIVVGHSLGAQIALGLAASDPGWPRALVLFAASGLSTAASGRRRALSASSIVRPARRFDPLRPWILKHGLTRRLAFSGLVSDVDSLSDSAAEAFFAGAAAAATQPATRALLENDPLAQLHRVRAPALVIWGARDVAVPVADGIDYARRLRAPLRILADTGHLVIGERPAECARLVDEFVAGLEG